MKKVLIISPYFPPSNAADMQRIRMSLPFFKQHGWEAEVVYVDQKYSDINKDPLLVESLPFGLITHAVQALSKKWTSKLGLGSIALRSLFFFKKEVNKLLGEKKFDLLYFSTTQFPVCVLGAYWKRKFRIPYVIDMQDPWHSDYYLTRPKLERPPKYWFSYRLNKIMEPIAMKQVDGIISVSEAYIRTLHQRYSQTLERPSATITFGAFDIDNLIVKKHLSELPRVFGSAEFLSLVYIGRGGQDMHKALTLLFSAFKRGLNNQPIIFKRFKLYFIGTSYAAKGKGIKTIEPVADKFALDEYVFEQTDRIPFYQGLANLQYADGLIVPGSDDPSYTASKLYPYIMAEKPLLGLFHEGSSAVEIIRKCNAGEMITLNENPDAVYKKLESYLASILEHKEPETDWTAFAPYTAKEMTRRQCELFEKVINN